MRLFVAFDVPDAVRASIDALIVKLRPTCRDARWVRSEVLHVTLKFIGEVSPDKVDEIKAALESRGIPRETRTFSPHLTLARFGDCGDLNALHAAIANAGPLEFGSAIAEEFHLYLSVLKPGEAEYTLLATFCSEESETR